MITEPIDVLYKYQVRKSAKQKDIFLNAVCSYVTSLGYPVAIEKGSFGSRNVLIGDIEKARYLITAHYDTPAKMFIPNIITPCNIWIYFLYQLLAILLLLIPSGFLGVLVGYISSEFAAGYFTWFFLYFGLLFFMMAGPANQCNANDNTSGVVTLLEIARSLDADSQKAAAFVLFDLEELGMIGSSSYRKRHKKDTEQQVVLNLDCVGDGNEIVLFPSKKLKKTPERLHTLQQLCGNRDGKSITLRKNGFSMYPSDQAQFPLGVGIGAFRKWKGILYCSRIHTGKDTVLEYENVEYIRNAVLKMLLDER